MRINKTFQPSFHMLLSIYIIITSSASYHYHHSQTASSQLSYHRYHEPIGSLNRERGQTSWTELGHFLIMYFDKRVERLILVANYAVRNESLSLTKQSMDSVAGKFTYLVPTNFIIVSKSITDHPADWKRSRCLISINSFAMMILHLHVSCLSCVIKCFLQHWLSGYEPASCR